MRMEADVSNDDKAAASRPGEGASLVPSRRRSFLIGFGLILGGIALFFLFLYVTEHDPDERPLALFEWVLAGMLIGPGVAYLVKWKRSQWH